MKAIAEKRVTKKQLAKQEQAEARDTLRGWLPPGSTVYTILRHVSRSGMFRRISLVATVDGKPFDIDYWASKAAGFTLHKDGGIGTGGCGMDMGYHLVHNLGYALYPNGFECIGRSEDRDVFCPSNDHSNGDRDYKPHNHSSGAYALRHRWL
jgi:hypothetical protein